MNYYDEFPRDGLTVVNASLNLTSLQLETVDVSQQSFNGTLKASPTISLV
jgi:hypothetical protein